MGEKRKTFVTGDFNKSAEKEVETKQINPKEKDITNKYGEGGLVVFPM